MKKSVLIILIIISVIEVKSQTYSQFQYTYDAAGNRIKREIIVISPSSPAPNTQNNNDSVGNSNNIANNIESGKLENFDGSVTNEQESNKSESLLGENKITVYPNPTTGELKIDISNFNPDSKGTIIVTDMIGKLITEIKNVSSSNLVNLYTTARGSYVLKLVLDGKSKEWVIVKE